MKTYCFVGNLCNVMERTYDAFGQRANFTDAQYRDVVLGGGAFIPEESFTEIGFTLEEIAAFGSSGNRMFAPDSLRDRVFRAEQVFRCVRDRMLRKVNVASTPPQEILAGEN